MRRGITFFRLGLLVMLFCPFAILPGQENGGDLNKLENNDTGVLFEDVRKERPPRPTGEAADIRFPSDFLTLSVPSEESEESEEPAAADKPGEKLEKKADSEITIAVVLSIIIFGVFTWTDYRYRQTIQQILAKNRRLLDGEMVEMETPAPALAGVGGDSIYPIYSESNFSGDSSGMIHRFQDETGGF